MTTTDPKRIDCPQISMGHGKVDVGIILHEGRKGLIFHPRDSYIPVGAPGETAGDYWPQPEDVIIWIDAPEGADVIVREIAPLATTPTTTDPKLIERASLIAEQAYSAGNLVTCDGYYEFDLDAAAAIVAAAINEAAHQWRDIATAPRDGSYIIAGRFGRSNELCWVKHSRWITAAEAAENEGQGFDAEDYEDGWTDGNDDWECCYPTHWMPLPSPPAIEAKESQHGE